MAVRKARAAVWALMLAVWVAAAARFGWLLAQGYEPREVLWLWLAICAAGLIQNLHVARTELRRTPEPPRGRHAKPKGTR